MKVRAENDMAENPVEEVLKELFHHLESLETQTGAVLQLLKARGIATDEQLAPYVEEAANSSNVKWRAARVRMEHLFAVSHQDVPRMQPNEEKANTQSIKLSKKNEGRAVDEAVQEEKNVPAENSKSGEAADSHTAAVVEKSGIAEDTKSAEDGRSASYAQQKRAEMNDATDLNGGSPVPENKPAA